MTISIDERFSRRYQNDFIRVIEVLERNLQAFNRTDFYIPKNENINDIIDMQGSIVRPVLSSLLSYAKILVKKVLIESKLIDDPYMNKFLHLYFPKKFAATYEIEINQHPLKREIIATCIADFVINSQGATFVSDFERLGVERYLNKIKSYIVVNELFDAENNRSKIMEHDFIMPIENQYRLINKMEYVIYASTRWMVKYLKQHELDANHIVEHKEELFSLLNNIHSENPIIHIQGDQAFNKFFSVIDYLRFAVAAINIKERNSHSFKDVVIIFYSLIHEFNILDIIVELNRVQIENQSDMTLRTQVLQFVEFIVVHYTQKVLDFKRINEEPEDAFRSFITNEKTIFIKVRNHLDIFKQIENKDIKDIAITVNQLMVSLI